MTWQEINDVVRQWTRDGENGQHNGPSLEAALAMGWFIEMVLHDACQRNSEPDDPSYITWETDGGIELGSPEGAYISAMQFTADGQARAVKKN